MSTGPVRKIIHVDMDAYYASIEQRDHPQYRGKPIAVGGSPEGRGGVVATASYEARAFGVRSAMPSKKAQQLCPQLIFVRPRFPVYQAVSEQIHDIFHRYTDLIEPLSLDEAFLDVTRDKLGIGSAIEIAQQIRAAIHGELKLTASAGVSVNKFVAKIASDLKKPDGLTFIGPSRIEAFVAALPVEKFFGVGKVTAEKMRSLRLNNGADIRKLSEEELIHHFGKTGSFFYRIVRGIDDREVNPNRDTKSVGAEDTFAEDLVSFDSMCTELERLATIVSERLQRHELKGRTLSIKVKFHDFRQLTRSVSVSTPIDDPEVILGHARGLLEELDLFNKKVRLLGISLSNFGESGPRPVSHSTPGQLKLF